MWWKQREEENSSQVYTQRKPVYFNRFTYDAQNCLAVFDCDPLFLVAKEPERTGNRHHDPLLREGRLIGGATANNQVMAFHDSGIWCLRERFNGARG